MAERDKKGNVIPQVGQVWHDNDKRAPGRYVRIDRIYHVDPMQPERAECTVLESRYSPNTAGRTFTMMVKRFRPNSTGYRFVADTEDEWRAKH